MDGVDSDIDDKRSGVDWTEVMYDCIPAHLLDWSTCEICMLPHQKHARYVVTRHFPVDISARLERLVGSPERATFAHQRPRLDADAIARPDFKYGLKRFEKDASTIRHSTTVLVGSSIRHFVQELLEE